MIDIDEARKRIAEANRSGKPANLRWADLRGANLLGANLSGANLSGASLRGTSVIRIHTTYEATIYPDGRLAYGCECHQVDDWPGLIDELCQRCEPSRAAEYRAEIEAILALARVATTMED